MSYVRDANDELLTINSFSRSTDNAQACLYWYKPTEEHAQGVTHWAALTSSDASSGWWGEILTTTGSRRFLSRYKINNGSTVNRLITTEFSLNEWYLVGCYYPAFNGTTQNPTLWFDNAENSGSGTIGTFSTTMGYCTIGRDAVATRGKYAEFSWYTSITDAEFDALYAAMYADGSTYKSPTHPDVVALGHTPYAHARLDDDTSMVTGAGLSITNTNGTFDGADNPTFASEAEPPGPAPRYRPRYIGL